MADTGQSRIDTGRDSSQAEHVAVVLCPPDHADCSAREQGLCLPACSRTILLRFEKSSRLLLCVIPATSNSNPVAGRVNREGSSSNALDCVVHLSMQACLACPHVSGQEQLQHPDMFERWRSLSSNHQGTRGHDFVGRSVSRMHRSMKPPSRCSCNQLPCHPSPRPLARLQPCRAHWPGCSCATPADIAAATDRA